MMEWAQEVFAGRQGPMIRREGPWMLRNRPTRLNSRPRWIKLLGEPGVVHQDHAGGSASCGQALGTDTSPLRARPARQERRVSRQNVLARGSTAGDLVGADEGPLKVVACRQEYEPNLFDLGGTGRLGSLRRSPGTLRSRKRLVHGGHGRPASFGMRADHDR